MMISLLRQTLGVARARLQEGIGCIAAYDFIRSQSSEKVSDVATGGTKREQPLQTKKKGITRFHLQPG